MFIATEVQTSSDVANAFMHSGNADSSSEAVRFLYLFQQLGSEATARVCNGDLDSAVVQVRLYNRGLAPGVTMDIGEGLLHKTEDRHFLAGMKADSLQALGNIHTDTESAPVPELFDKHAQGGPQTQFTKHRRMQKIREGANLAGNAFCQGERLGNLFLSFFGQGIPRRFQSSQIEGQRGHFLRG